MENTLGTLFTTFVNAVGDNIAAKSHKNMLETIHNTLTITDNVNVTQLLDLLQCNNEQDLANKILAWCSSNNIKLTCIATDNIKNKPKESDKTISSKINVVTHESTDDVLADLNDITTPLTEKPKLKPKKSYYNNLSYCDSGCGTTIERRYTSGC